MLATVLVLFAIVGVGYVSKRMGLVEGGGGEVIQKTVMNLTLPAAIILSFMSANLGRQHLEIVGAGVAMVFLTLGFYLLVFKLFLREKEIYVQAVILAFFSNAGFLGLPVIESLYGREALSQAFPFQMLSHGPIWLFLLGGAVLAFGGKKRKLDGKGMLRKVFLQVPVLAIPIGIGLSYLTVPGVVKDFLGVLADANTFLIMFFVGVLLEPKAIARRLWWPVGLVVLCTLFVTPMISYFVGAGFGLGDLNLQIVTLEGAMPMAILTVLLIREYGYDVEFAEAVLFVSTVLSVITLPTVQYMFFKFA